MRLKILSAVLACTLLLSIPINSQASYVTDIKVDETATNEMLCSAGLIFSYSLSCSSGTKTVYITAKTTGNEIMSKIGFKNIKIQRSSDGSNWTTEKTVSNQLADGKSTYSLERYAVTVNGGYYYRVVLDHYAKENTWLFPDEQSLTNTSSKVWVS
jgi:hypothetical protein